jgi:hypothetical protein
LTENDKLTDNKDLPQAVTSAYKPAYKNNPKTDENRAQNLPDDLAEIVTAWPNLPDAIKAAVKALIQTYNTETKKL